MYRVELDRGDDRLYLTLEGRMDRSEIAAAAEETIAAARELDDGFVVINDISEFAPPSPEDAEPIREAQVRLVDLGLEAAVRVVGEDPSAVVSNAFERRSRDVGYRGSTAETVPEAERKLAELG